MLRPSLLATAHVAVLGLLAPLAPLSLGAQSAPTVRVQGVVYDSLRSRPLAGAIVTLSGDSRITRSDSRGRFVFDSVPPGARTFAAQHAALDSVGFSGISARVTVTDGAKPIVIAAPSFASLWRTACGPTRPPKDSGFVYGTVRHAATQSIVPNAAVQVTWLDLSVDKAKRILQDRWSGESASDETGNYSICGVPVDVGLRIRASVDSSGSGSISLLGTGARVQRRDLSIGPVEFDPAAPIPRGIISGFVSDTAGRPIADARVIADGAPELRSGADGKFVVRAVPVGSRQVEILSIGMSPVLTVADVTPTDTAVIVASMRKITTLDVIRVTASPMTRRIVRDIDDRRKLGAGYYRDSTEVANHGSLFSVFFEFPNVDVRRAGATSNFVVILPGTSNRKCAANVVIDGRRGDFEELSFLRPSDIAAVEVFPRRMNLPMQFVRDNDCGAVIVWTKWALAG
jgi:hypothetical protein